jgi:hypothetical protein
MSVKNVSKDYKLTIVQALFAALLVLIAHDFLRLSRRMKNDIAGKSILIIDTRIQLRFFERIWTRYGHSPITKDMCVLQFLNYLV